MGLCQCPACLGRNTKWTTTPPGWTDTHASNPQLPPIPEHLQNLVEGAPLGQQCKAEDNNMADGVFLWVETNAAGHSFVSVHSQGKITVYTYGRYGDMPPGNPMVGEGILLRMSDNSSSFDYMSEQLYRWQANVYKILDADKLLVDAYLSGIYTDSAEVSRNPRGDMTRQFGRVIDQYDLTGNNCTTHSVKAIRFGGSRIFERTLVGFTYTDDFTIPGSLSKYMQQVSADAIDLRAMAVTDQAKEWIPNSKGWTSGQASNEERVMGSSAATAGYAGSSTGYAGGTIGGSLGGSYEPGKR